ncbi:MAG TPA: UDP-N-acetylmuramoyl-L-alanyl-D-glutamate--2,6-diaminopimelate ligase [Candidatus Cloacimonetes bacterium]|nr:UDP-N-acetylmuramoyl-L-alanyl-D-glutamate--2,6-diaminopimelate ligase [Candidatus Cloacimonadota bacterium]
MTNKLLELYKEHGIYISDSVCCNFEHLPVLAVDTRKISSLSAFVAIKGENFDGHDHIAAAKRAGAVLIIGESKECNIQVTDSRKAAALYAKLSYHDPGAKLTLFGFTGTNGKTTASLMLFQLLRAAGYKTGWIGTMGYKIEDESFSTAHTTPDILELNEIFTHMIRKGVTHVAMEVSSHALSLDRVYGIDFDYALFSNFSQDHLDFHKDMDDYFEAKYLLFKRAKTSIINGDDARGEEICFRLKKAERQVYCIGEETHADLVISNMFSSLEASSFDLISKEAMVAISSPLIGYFNIDNLALAIAAMHFSGHSLTQISEWSSALIPVQGRLEPLENDREIGIYIDYAHTPEALISLLKSIGRLPHRRIISVVGAGGNRDKLKRPLMLKAALGGSDAVIITDDNPRNENPDRIIYDMVRDSSWILPWWITRDRKAAIEAAIRLAAEGDIVLICGKGHENYQEIEGVRHDFDDKLAAKEVLQELSESKHEDELILPFDELLLKIMMEEEPTGEGYRAPKTLRNLSTDTRTLRPHSLFIAIKGENFDGNDFVEDVLSDPSNSVICSKEIEAAGLIQAPSPETLMALLMQKYLQMFEIYKIAITGSTGKTSVKELIAQVFSYKADVLKTSKNENNIIGLTKTILRVCPTDKYAIFEIGSNHLGEIDLLANTITPDAGLILNVGPSHLQYFKDEDGVFKEKTDLFQRALQIRLYPADDPRFEIYRDSAVGVGFAPHADCRIQNVLRGDDGLSFDLGERTWHIPYLAPHFAINASFAICLALRLGLDADDIQAALSQKIMMDMRMQIREIDGRIVIIDCYNANPVSMQAAIEFWRDYEPDLPHIAFAGDMLELGESAELYHEMIGAIFAESGHDEIYSIGKYAKSYQQDAARHFEDVFALLDRFPQLPKPAVILLKASNGMKLFKILAHLLGEE